MNLNKIEQTANLVHNNQMSLMVFQMRFSFMNTAPVFYGINVFKVREVIEGKLFPVSSLPEAHHLIEGMIQLRGTFLPVIDLPQWLGVPMSAEDKEKSVIIVSDFSHNLVGLRVAHIHGVEEKSWDQLHPAENMTVSGSQRVVNRTTVSYQGEDALCYILDVEALLAECLPDVADQLDPKFDPEGDWKSAFFGKTLLLADDSKAIRVYLNNVMQQLGISFELFENGQELINHLAGLTDFSTLAGIVTDLEMPVASGHTVIKYVRQHPQLKDLPIAVHSSMTSENNARDSLSLGANIFIGKINTEGLIDGLKQMTQLMSSIDD